MSQVFQEHSHCYNKRKKDENENYENLFILLPSLPSQEGGGCGGGGGGFYNPHPSTFFTAKIFEIFFHRSMGIWTKCG